MMIEPLDRGFEEIAHTADWALRVWAPDLPELFAQAAQGMYALMQVRLEPAPRLERALEIEGADAESLLVSFLSDLLYYGEHEGVGFDTFDIQVDGTRLRAVAGGAPIAQQNKEIKAVTFHNLAVYASEAGVSTIIVFDV